MQERQIMKKLIKALIILVILIFIAIGGIAIYAAKNATTLVSKYKPQIEDTLSKTLKSKVALGNLDVSIFPNAKIIVSEFKISKDSNSKGLTFNNLSVDVSLLPLLSGNLNIVKVSLDNPLITIIKSKSGIMIDGLETNKKPVSKSNTTKSKKSSKAEIPTLPNSISANLEEFSINNANIKFIDKLAGQEYDISDLSITSALEFASNVANLKNLEINGTALDIADFGAESSLISFDLETTKLNFSEIVLNLLKNNFNLSGFFNLKNQSGETKLNSNSVSIPSLVPLISKFAPIVNTFNLKGDVSPNLNVTLPKAGIYNAIGDINLKNLGLNFSTININEGSGNLKINANNNVQTIKSNNFKFNIDKYPANLKLDTKISNGKATKSTFINIFSGIIDLNSSANLTSKNKDFSSIVKISNIELEDASSAFLPKSPVKITGTVENSNLDINGELSTIPSSIKGKGNLLLKDGELKGSNLVNLVLGAVKDLPFLSGSLLDVAPEELRGEIEGEDTPIRSLEALYTIKDSALNLNKLSLESTIFSLNGTGTIGFNSKINLNVQFVFNEKFSESLVAKAKEAKRLIGKDGRLSLPIQIIGTAPKLIAIPDLKELVKQGATREIEKKIEEKAGQLLNKLFQ